MCADIRVRESCLQGYLILLCRRGCPLSSLLSNWSENRMFQIVGRVLWRSIQKLELYLPHGVWEWLARDVCVCVCVCGAVICHWIMGTHSENCIRRLRPCGDIRVHHKRTVMLVGNKPWGILLSIGVLPTGYHYDVSVWVCLPVCLPGFDHLSICCWSKDWITPPSLFRSLIWHRKQ